MRGTMKLRKCIQEGTFLATEVGMGRGWAHLFKWNFKKCLIDASKRITEMFFLGGGQSDNYVVLSGNGKSAFC